MSTARTRSTTPAQVGDQVTADEPAATRDDDHIVTDHER